MDNKINNNNNFFENKLIKNKDSVFNNIFINDETTIQKKILIYKIIATLTAIINLFFSEYIKFLLLVEIILIIYLIFNFLLFFHINTVSFRKFEKFTIYIDIIVISTIIVIRGGIRSDFFLGYILIMQYIALIPYKSSINFSIFFIIIIYLISCILAEKNFFINSGRFIIRSTFLLVSYFILSFIIKIVKSYNSIQHYAFDKLLRDSLTGVYNRNLFEEIFANQFVHSKNQVYIMIDIDNMKEINDTYGHLAGDKTLKTIGEIFLLNLRKTDICIRYGGDEFLILLNKISIKNSIKLTERIINIINNTIIIFDNKKLNFTISCGISEIPLNYTYKEAIKFVDEKLYKAKKEGKNKIIY